MRKLKLCSSSTCTAKLKHALLVCSISICHSLSICLTSMHRFHIACESPSISHHLSLLRGTSRSQAASLLLAEARRLELQVQSTKLDLEKSEQTWAKRSMVSTQIWFMVCSGLRTLAPRLHACFQKLSSLFNCVGISPQSLVELLHNH